MTSTTLVPRNEDTEPSPVATIVVTLLPLLLVLGPIMWILARFLKRSAALQERSLVHMDKMETLTERMVVALEAIREPKLPPS